MKNNKVSKQDENKVELAKKIADQSQKVARTYENFEEYFFKIVRWFSNAIDKLLFNPRYGVIVSLFLAVLLYATINLNDLSSLFNNTLESSRKISATIYTEYNSDKWEISGFDEQVDVLLTGDPATINTQLSTTGYRILANLTNLTAGTHTVKLIPEKFISGLDVTVNPSHITVIIKEKITQNRDITFDYINTDKMESIYVLGTPEFEMTKVAVRASESTLNSVAFVKALIDVKGMTSDFEQYAKLVAYDQNGNTVKADIKPESVKVNVKVTSPNKQLPVVVEPQGQIPNGKAIESITMDHSSVTVFAPDSVLNVLPHVSVTFDASQLKSDSRIYQAITMPTGVKQLSVTKVNMEIKLDDEVSRIIDDLPISRKNYFLNKKASFSFYRASVEVHGTQTNIDKITADDINVFIDLSNVQVGLGQEVPIQITPRNDLLVRFTPVTGTIIVDILGEDQGTDEGVND